MSKSGLAAPFYYFVEHFENATRIYHTIFCGVLNTSKSLLSGLLNKIFDYCVVSGMTLGLRSKAAQEEYDDSKLSDFAYFLSIGRSATVATMGACNIYHGSLH